MQQSDFIFLNINITYFNPILGLLIISQNQKIRILYTKMKNFFYKHSPLFFETQI